MGRVPLTRAVSGPKVRNFKASNFVTPTKRGLGVDRVRERNELGFGRPVATFRLDDIDKQRFITNKSVG